MRLERLVARSFRNLEDLDRALPAEGAILLGANGQGKTNLLEALYYPVLFRSLRGAPDPEVGRFGGPGFHVEAAIAAGTATLVSATYVATARKKRIAMDGVEVARVADAVGAWVAVAFLPTDVGLAAGPATERRQYLDRLLSLADPRYLRALARYRAALAQRNSALRQGHAEVAQAFNGALAGAGAAVVVAREAWAGEAAARFAAEFACLGEPAPARLRY